jgi:hypothetical protein
MTKMQKYISNLNKSKKNDFKLFSRCSVERVRDLEIHYFKFKEYKDRISRKKSR